MCFGGKSVETDGIGRALDLEGWYWCSRSHSWSKCCGCCFRGLPLSLATRAWGRSSPGPCLISGRTITSEDADYIGSSRPAFGSCALSSDFSWPWSCGVRLAVYWAGSSQWTGFPSTWAKTACRRPSADAESPWASNPSEQHRSTPTQDQYFLYFPPWWAFPLWLSETAQGAPANSAHYCETSCYLLDLSKLSWSNRISKWIHCQDQSFECSAIWCFSHWFSLRDSERWCPGSEPAQIVAVLWYW